MDGLTPFLSEMMTKRLNMKFTKRQAITDMLKPILYLWDYSNFIWLYYINFLEILRKVPRNTRVVKILRASSKYVLIVEYTCDP
jgi:hypothetical protein